MNNSFIWAKVNNDDLNAIVVGEVHRKIFEELGYSVYNYARWDERLAPKNWDTSKHGMPNTYYMQPQIDFKKEYNEHMD